MSQVNALEFFFFFFFLFGVLSEKNFEKVLQNSVVNKLRILMVGIQNLWIHHLFNQILSKFLFKILFKILDHTWSLSKSIQILSKFLFKANLSSFSNSTQNLNSNSLSTPILVQPHILVSLKFTVSSIQNQILFKFLCKSFFSKP